MLKGLTFHNSLMCPVVVFVTFSCIWEHNLHKIFVSYCAWFPSLQKNPFVSCLNVLAVQYHLIIALDIDHIVLCWHFRSVFGNEMNHKGIWERMQMLSREKMVRDTKEMSIHGRISLRVVH